MSESQEKEFETKNRLKSTNWTRKLTPIKSVYPPEPPIRTDSLPTSPSPPTPHQTPMIHRINSSCQSTPRIHRDESLSSSEEVTLHHSNKISNSQITLNELALDELNHELSHNTHSSTTSISRNSTSFSISASSSPTRSPVLHIEAVYLYDRVDDHEQKERGEGEQIHSALNEVVLKKATASNEEVHGSSPYHAVGSSSPSHTLENRTTTTSPAFYASASACTQKNSETSIEQEEKRRQSCEKSSHVDSGKTKIQEESRGTNAQGQQRAYREPPQPARLANDRDYTGSDHQNTQVGTSPSSSYQKAIYNNIHSQHHFDQRFACNASIVIDCERKIKRNRSADKASNSSKDTVSNTKSSPVQLHSTTSVKDRSKQKYQVQSKHLSGKWVSSWSGYKSALKNEKRRGFSRKTLINYTPFNLAFLGGSKILHKLDQYLRKDLKYLFKTCGSNGNMPNSLCFSSKQKKKGN